MNAKPKDIDSYLAALPEAQRNTLETMRRTIRSLCPEAVESISYDVPTFKYKGRPLAYLGAARNHCSLYGIMVDAHKEALAGYDVSRGTVRYPIGEPLPETLVKTLLEARVAQIDAPASKGKKPKAG